MAATCLPPPSQLNFYSSPSYSIRRSTPSIQSRSYNSIISCGSVSGTRSMAVLVKRSASRNGGSDDGNEQFTAVEQESVVNSSSKLRNAGGGIQAIVNRVSKWLVVVVFVSIMVLRHDGAAMWAFIGWVSNYGVSLILKRILNQERPDATMRSDPGMPSSHAQSISYASVFSVLSVIEWLGTNQVSLLLSALILALGSYLIWLRVSQKLHTSSQVVVGAIVGSVFCMVWYTTWNSLLLQAFQSSLTVQITVFLTTAVFSLAIPAYVIRNRNRSKYDK